MQVGYNVSMDAFKIDFPLARSEVISMLKHYKISPTRPRIEIAKFLFQQPQHLSAEKILDGISAAGKRVSRATIYNTMGLFSRKGVVREILINRERVFYDTNTSAHQHLYNIDTGELSDVYHTEPGMITNPELPDDLKIIDTDIIFKVSSK